MATLISIKWLGADSSDMKQETATRYALHRWMTNTMAPIFITADDSVIITDLHPNSNHFTTLLHLLKVNRVDYHATYNVDMKAVAEAAFIAAQANPNQTNLFT